MKIKYLILALAVVVPGIITMEKPENPHAFVLGKRQADSSEADLDDQPQTKISRRIIVPVDSDSDTITIVGEKQNRFTNPSDLSQHQNIPSSTSERRYLINCPYCSSLSDTQKSNVLDHIAKCHPNQAGRHKLPLYSSEEKNNSVQSTTNTIRETSGKQFKCNHKGCNFATDWQGNLNRHIRTKHSTKPSDSSQHEKIHSSETQTTHNKCNYCNKWFTKDILVKHIAEIHNKIPLYLSEEKNNSVQNTIGKTVEQLFKNQHTRNNHRANPSDEPLIRCPWCSGSVPNYIRKSLVRKHLLEIHNHKLASYFENKRAIKGPASDEPLIYCPSCDGYIRKGLFLPHMVRIHKDKLASYFENDDLLSIPSEKNIDAKLTNENKKDLAQELDNAITKPASAPIILDLTNDDLLSIPSEKNIDAKLTNEDEKLKDLAQELDDALEDSSDCGGTTETASSPDIITSKNVGNPIPFEFPVELPDSFDDQDMLNEKNLDVESKDLLEELDDALEDSYESGSTTETASSPDTTTSTNILSKRSARENKKALAKQKTTRPKHYQCDTCGNNFTAKSSLTNHIKKHHEKKYECMYCNYSTAHRSNLDYHQKTEHQR